MHHITFCSIQILLVWSELSANLQDAVAVCSPTAAIHMGRLRTVLDTTGSLPRCTIHGEALDVIRYLIYANAPASDNSNFKLVVSDDVLKQMKAIGLSVVESTATVWMATVSIIIIAGRGIGNI